MNGSVIAFVLAGVVGATMAWSLRHRRVVVTADEIAATLPWFAVIGIAVAIGRAVPVSGLTAGFLRSPTVYLVVGALVAGLWVTLDAVDVNDTSQWTAASGVLTTIAVGGGSLLMAEALQLRVLAWNAVSIGLAIGITALVLGTVLGGQRTAHGWLSGSVLFAHVLDATTTGVGLERLGMSERNPISATVIQMGDGIGPSGVILFLLVKVTVAVLVLSALDSDADRAGRETVGVLVIAAGTGFVPAVHNLALFTLTIH